MYLDERVIGNIIIVDEYIFPIMCSPVIVGEKKGYMSRGEFEEFMNPPLL